MAQQRIAFSFGSMEDDIGGLEEERERKQCELVPSRMDGWKSLHFLPRYTELRKRVCVVGSFSLSV